MIKFIEFTNYQEKVLIQINDVRKVCAERDTTRMYFTDGTYTVVSHTYNEVCEMIRNALS